MAKIRLASSLQTDSIVDGPGLRLVVWTQGCPHHCPGCHNPQSHDFNEGQEVDIDLLCKEIKEYDYHTGITFSGGEPMLQAKQCIEIARYAKLLGLDVWCYSGYTWEELLDSSDESIHQFIELIDVLVDGKFMNGLKSLELKFKGSSNQRCIDVQKTRETKVITQIN